MLTMSSFGQSSGSVLTELWFSNENKPLVRLKDTMRLKDPTCYGCKSDDVSITSASFNDLFCIKIKPFIHW